MPEQKLHAISGNTGLPECPTCHGEGVLAHVPPKRVRLGKLLGILLLDIELQLADDPKAHPRVVYSLTGPPYTSYNAQGPTWGSFFVAGILSGGAAIAVHNDLSPWLWALPAFFPVAWSGIYLKHWLKSAIERSRA